MTCKLSIEKVFVLVALRFASVEAGLQVKDNMKPATVTGTSASLTEDGYQIVASLKNDWEMEQYIKRILASEGKTVRPYADSKLDGFVQYFSGTRAMQSLQQLRHELQSVDWVNRVSNLEVDIALDTLKTEKVSSLSNASAYALAIASALSSEEGSSRTRIFVEADLLSKPLDQLAEELEEAKDAKAKVVYQKDDGKVMVLSPKDLAVEMIKSPLKKWTEVMKAKRGETAEPPKPLRDERAVTAGFSPMPATSGFTPLPAAVANGPKKEKGPKKPRRQHHHGHH